MEGNVIAHLLDMLIIIVAFWAIDRFIKAKTGKGLKDRYTESLQRAAKGMYEAQNEKMEDYKGSERLLFEKFCRIAKMTPLNAFKLARDEMGFGHSDEKVEKHLEQYVSNNYEELPNYVEAFINKGRDYIINAKE